MRRSEGLVNDGAEIGTSEYNSVLPSPFVVSRTSYVAELPSLSVMPQPIVPSGPARKETLPPEPLTTSMLSPVIFKYASVLKSVADALFEVIETSPPRPLSDSPAWKTMSPASPLVVLPVARIKSPESPPVESPTQRK